MLNISINHPWIMTSDRVQMPYIGAPSFSRYQLFSPLISHNPLLITRVNLQIQTRPIADPIIL